MAYEYDNDNGFRPERPQPPKKDNDIGAWIFIAVMFTVAWPIGLILLLIKLSESGNKKKNAHRTTGQSGQRTSQRVGQTAQAEKARTAVKQVTQTPDYTDKGGRTMKIIGAILGIAGCLALFSAVGDNLSYAYHYNEWWYFARQLFYPLGMTAGGVSLLLGSGVMKRRQRRGAKARRAPGLSGPCGGRIPPPCREGPEPHAGEGPVGRRGVHRHGQRHAVPVAGRRHRLF